MERLNEFCATACRSFSGEVLRLTQDAGQSVVVRDPAKLRIEVEAGVHPTVLLLYREPVSSSISIALETDAKLTIAQLFTAEAFAEVQVTQEARSRLCMTTLQLSSANLSCRVDLNGADAESYVYALFMAGGEEHCHIDLRTNHNMPDCRSESVVKGVAGGCVRGEFYGLVYVAPDAQRTDARQQSRNLLLSETARISMQPQLEIYADDVKCSHGATVGQMDTDAILYMRQRGIDEAQARRLQIEGFVADVVMHCDIETLREPLMEAVTAKLERM